MLKSNVMAQVSRRSTELVKTVNAAYRAAAARNAGEDVPEGSPRLADCTDAVGFYLEGFEDPLFFDAKYHRKKKHDRWSLVSAPDPALSSMVADTHAHLHSLPHPGFSIARAGAANMAFLGAVTDPTADGTVVFDRLEEWQKEGAILVRSLVPKC